MYLFPLRQAWLGKYAAHSTDTLVKTELQKAYLLPVAELLPDKPELEEESEGKAPDHEGALPDGVAAEAAPAPARR